MFSRKKKNPPKPKASGANARSRGRRPDDDFGLGLFGVGRQASLDDEALEAELRALSGGFGTTKKHPPDGDSDEDLEAELLNLVGGKSKTGKKRAAERQPEQPILTDLRHVLSADVDDDNDDVDVDENDPDLLQELMELNGLDDDEEGEEEEDSQEEAAAKEEPKLLTVLQERLDMYKTAEKKAKDTKESARARRFTRGIKTLEGLIRKAQAGQPVLDSEIPPMIATSLKPPSVGDETGPSQDLPASIDTTPPARQKPPKPEDIGQRAEDVDVLPPDRDMDVTVDTNTPLPIQGVVADSDITEPVVPDIDPSVLPQENTSPVCDTGNGETEPEPINTTSSPGVTPVEKKSGFVGNPEDEMKKTAAANPLLVLLRARREEFKMGALNAKKSNDMASALSNVKAIKLLDSLITTAQAGGVVDEKMIPSLIGGVAAPSKPPPSKTSAKYKVPATVLEALEQRLAVYKQYLASAEREKNETSIKQNGKIVRLYTEVIKMHKQGKAIPVERLPCPPGCPPIPVAFQV